jgi:hypothetical protein
VAKGSKTGTKPKGKPAKLQSKTGKNEATIDEFEREGMGVAPKE